MPLARCGALLLAASFVAGCVDAPKPPGIPGTTANPASGTLYVFLTQDSIRPKQSYVVPGTNVVFEDLQGSAHTLDVPNHGNLTFEVPANASTTFHALELGDYRLVCRMHGNLSMRGWLHVVPPGQA